MKKFQFTFTLPLEAFHIVAFLESITTGDYKMSILMNAHVTVSERDGRSLVSLVGNLTDLYIKKFDVLMNALSAAADSYAAANNCDCNLTFFAVGPSDEPSK